MTNPEEPVAPSIRPRILVTGAIAVAAIGLLALFAKFTSYHSGFDSLRLSLVMKFVSFVVMLVWITAFIFILDTPLRRYRLARAVFVLVFLGTFFLGAMGFARLILLTAAH